MNNVKKIMFLLMVFVGGNSHSIKAQVVKVVNASNYGIILNNKIGIKGKPRAIHAIAPRLQAYINFEDHTHYNEPIIYTFTDDSNNSNVDNSNNFKSIPGKYGKDFTVRDIVDNTIQIG